MGGVTRGQVQKLNDESATCGLQHGLFLDSLYAGNVFADEKKRLYRVCFVLALCRSHDLQDRDKLNNLNSRCADVNIYDAQYIKPIYIFRKKSIGFVLFFISRPNTVNSFGND